MTAVVGEVKSWGRQAKSNFTQLFKVSETRQHAESGFEKDSDSQKELRTGIDKFKNPVHIVMLLNRQQWAVLLGTLLILAIDFFDLYTLSISTVKLATYFKTTKGRISEAITYTMLTRAVGAIIFGILGDLIGRKWPLVICCVMLGIFQIACVYCKTLDQFLAVRAVFGIALGGVWGCSGAAALEQAPKGAHGFVSGFFASCSSVAFIAAAAGNLGFGAAPDSWKKLFLVGAGMSFFGALVRLVVPDAKQFTDENNNVYEVHLDQNGKEIRVKKRRSLKAFFRHLRDMLKSDWRMLAYCAVFVGIGLFYASSITNTYTTFLVSGKGLSNSDASKASMIMKCGGVVGCMMSGYISETLGRRRTICIMGLLSCAMIPALVLPTSMLGLAFGGFAIMVCTHGMSGVYPIHLNELFEPSFRAFLPGFAYALGATIASPSPQMINMLADKYTIMVKGKEEPAYGPIIGITVGVLAFCKVLWVAIGPEKRGRNFEDFVPAALTESECSSMVDLKKYDSAEVGNAVGVSDMPTLSHNGMKPQHPDAEREVSEAERQRVDYASHSMIM